MTVIDSGFALPPLAELDMENVPRISTPIPGPRSQDLWERDSVYHAGNSSAGAQFTQLVLHDALGALVRDVDGNVFIDFSSGTVVTGLGHCPREVVEALHREVDRLLHYYDFATAPRPQFFEALARTLPDSLQVFQMYTTGTEAVEAAIRVAKSATKKYEVLSFYNAFHGRTMGAMSLMGGSPQKRGFGPFVPGALHSVNAYCYRCPLGLTRDSCEVACARFVDKVYEQESDNSLAAVIIEPVQGSGGVIAHPPEFLRHLRQFCDRTGALLIFDEILTGAGRTGTMWAFEQAGVVPDILVAGKGLASGYPISLIAARRDLLDAEPFGAPGGGSTTFASSNLAAAAGLATLELFADGKVLENAREVGAAMLAALNEMADRHPLIGNVRGQGMLMAVELVSDRQAKTPVAAGVGKALLLALARRGVLTVTASHILRIAPPLVIPMELAMRGVELLDEALTEVEGGLPGR